MAPKRGGQGGAGASVSTTRQFFEPPPLRRMHPWEEDGSANTDIIAGGVDASGLFKGVYISGVHMLALLRTFKLGKVFLPVDTPTPVMSLGQSLSDGIPIVIVTRNCFGGRAKDTLPGPLRNTVKDTVWEEARKLRAEMPQLHLTMVDVPMGLPSDMIQACLVPPLSEYNELVYNDGSWYCPATLPGEPLLKWMKEHRRTPYKVLHPPSGSKAADTAVQFKRTKFSWRETEEKTDWVYDDWKKILEVRPPAEFATRSDLDFSGSKDAQIAKHLPDTEMASAAERALMKALAHANESGESPLDAIATYLLRATSREAKGLDLVIKACHAVQGSSAKSLEVIALLLKLDVSQALEVCGSYQPASACDTIACARAEMLCHYFTGDLDKALVAADKAKAKLSSEQGGIAESMAQMQAVANVAVSDFEAALKTVSSPLLRAGVHILKTNNNNGDLSNMAEAAVEFAKARDENKHSDARMCAACTLALASVHMSMGSYGKSLEASQELAAMHSQDLSIKCFEAMGMVVGATAQLLSFSKTQDFLEGEADAMHKSLQSAVDIFARLGHVRGKTVAQQVLNQAKLAQDNPARATACADFAKSCLRLESNWAGLSMGLLKATEERLNAKSMAEAFVLVRQLEAEADVCQDESMIDMAFVMAGELRKGPAEGTAVIMGGVLTYVT